MIGLFIAVLFILPASALADGKALFKSKGCSGCHGAMGAKASGMIPQLMGKDVALLQEKLTGYRDGTIKSKGAMLMNNKMVKSLSDEEIVAITTWLAGHQ